MRTEERSVAWKRDGYFVQAVHHYLFIDQWRAAGKLPFQILMRRGPYFLQTKNVYCVGMLSEKAQ